MSVKSPFRPGREGPTLEWKVSLPRSDRVAATFAAFANGAGGRLLVGVSDSGELVGVDDAAAVRSALERLAAERLDPPVPVRTRRISVDGKVVVEARIERVDDGPVAAVTRGGRSAVYVREGSSSRPADASELRALGRSRSAGALSADDDTRRVLAALRKKTRRASEVARAAGLGARAAKRAVARLTRAGWVLERDDGRLWVTPVGHDRSGGDR
ncbi:MAG: helix-turn-helix domain-containing protein [Planctomycetota bacterium JB042]